MFISIYFTTISYFFSTLFLFPYTTSKNKNVKRYNVKM